MRIAWWSISTAVSVEGAWAPLDPWRGWVRALPGCGTSHRTTIEPGPELATLLKTKRLQARAEVDAPPKTVGNQP
jgi:hypothetical protein